MKKLRYVNNWESDEYYIGDTHVEDMKVVSVNGKKYKVFNKIVKVPYYDHGHTYNAISRHFFIEEPTFKHMIDLNEIIKAHDIYLIK